MTKEQRQEYNRAWRAANPERVKAARLRQRAHKKARARIYYKENRDKIRAHNADNYRRNPQPVKNRAREWRLKNVERCKANRRRYVNEHREILADKQLARYYANYREHTAKHAEYRVTNREILRLKSRIRTLEMTDGYVREQLSKYTDKLVWEWTTEQVSKKRIQILCSRLKRITKEKAAEIRVRFNESNDSQTDIARDYGVSTSLVSMILLNKIHPDPTFAPVRRIRNHKYVARVLGLLNAAAALAKHK